MKKAENIIVGISIGDLNGIGSEVILKTFEDSRMLELCTPVIFANVKVLSFIKKTLELTAPLHGIDKIEQLVVGKINVLNIWREGVDLNFGVNSSEDYSTGSLEQKTDLEVGLSKKLLNDRLTITVGSSFGLEGPRTQDQSSSNIAGNVNIDYALSNDGWYRLRFYRRDQNEGIVEGQIIETGVGFTLVVDYNKFREIFQKRAKRLRNQTEQKPKDETTN